MPTDFDNEYGYQNRENRKLSLLSYYLFIHVSRGGGQNFSIYKVAHLKRLKNWFRVLHYCMALNVSDKFYRRAVTFLFFFICIVDFVRNYLICIFLSKQSITKVSFCCFNECY